jgi:hypothetical protein
MIGCSLGYPKEYLMGVITVLNSNGEIEKITFHFKDFPYNVTTGCHLSSKNIGKYIYSGPNRDVHQYECNFNTSLYDSTLQESKQLDDDLSPFAGEIEESNSPINRSSYIHILAGFCSTPSQI